MTSPASIVAITDMRPPHRGQASSSSGRSGGQYSHSPPSCAGSVREGLFTRVYSVSVATAKIPVLLSRSYLG